jgi:hypothetical protein
MYKFSLLIAATMTVAGLISLTTKTKIATPTERANALMPSIERMTLSARDLPEQSFQAF